MNGYFRPLRRKLGILTIAMACVFAAMWVRSCYYDDWCFVRLGDTYYLLQSELGRLTCKKWPTPPPNGDIFGLRPHFTVMATGIARRFLFSISYSASAISLTLVSAWLLLSKPRLKPTPTQSQTNDTSHQNT